MEGAPAEVEEPEFDDGVTVAAALEGVVVAPVWAAPDALDVQETAEGTETPTPVQSWIFPQSQRSAMGTGDALSPPMRGKKLAREGERVCSR